MFTFDKDRLNQPVAIIRDGKMKNEVIYMKKDVSDETKTKAEYHDAIEIPREFGVLEYIPLKEKSQRDVLYICGKSGSGKSTFSRAYVMNYLRQYPSHKVYLFSQVDSDKAFDDIKGLYRVIIDNELINEETGGCNITSDEVKNSLCILDDIDVIADKKLLNALYEFENRLLETGRHTNTAICRTSHLITNYKRSRTVLNESNRIVLFLNGCPSGSTRNYLRAHYGMTNRQINKLYGIKSRWVMLANSYPSFILSQQGIYSMKSLDE